MESALCSLRCPSVRRMSQRGELGTVPQNESDRRLDWRGGQGLFQQCHKLFVWWHADEVQPTLHHKKCLAPEASSLLTRTSRI